MTAANPALTVIGGYLGAGKTTLLNHLLCNTEGSRIAVIVNDFGNINIDADLVESTGTETIALANGCLCCTLVDGMATVLARLRERADVDHIVVEASGVSDPVKIGHYGAAFGFPLLGVIVVADAERVRTLARDKYVGDTVIRQLRSADLLVVNKTDLVTASDVAAVQEWLAGLVPGVVMVATQAGRVAPSTLLGPGRHSVDRVDEASGAAHAEFEAWSLEIGQPLARGDVEALLAALPDGVMRAKGFLRLADDDNRQYVLQMVGRRSSLTPRDAGDQAADRLVVIGVPGSIDEGRFARLLSGAPSDRSTGCSTPNGS